MVNNFSLTLTQLCKLHRELLLAPKARCLTCDFNGAFKGQVVVLIKEMFFSKTDVKFLPPSISKMH